MLEQPIPTWTRPKRHCVRSAACKGKPAGHWLMGTIRMGTGEETNANDAVNPIP